MRTDFSQRGGGNSILMSRDRALLLMKNHVRSGSTSSFVSSAWQAAVIAAPPPLLHPPPLLFQRKTPRFNLTNFFLELSFHSLFVLTKEKSKIKIPRGALETRELKSLKSTNCNGYLQKKKYICTGEGGGDRRNFCFFTRRRRCSNWDELQHPVKK